MSLMSSLHNILIFLTAFYFYCRSWRKCPSTIWPSLGSRTFKFILLPDKHLGRMLLPRYRVDVCVQVYI